MSITINSELPEVYDYSVYPTRIKLPSEPTKVTIGAITRNVTFSGDFLVQVSGTDYLVEGSNINPRETDFTIGQGEGVKSVSVVIGEKDESTEDNENVIGDYVVEPLYSDSDYSDSDGYATADAINEVGVVMTTLRDALIKYERGDYTEDNVEEIFSLTPDDIFGRIPY